jgi:predicted thioredoxin/glutaredoxin
VIYTGNRGKKPDIISLSDEFFDGEDSSLEITAKVIYERDTHDIINQYIIFCKVFDDQRKLYGLTAKAVKETIRICKDRDVLKEYLESREKEVVTIMGKLFDTEDIMRIYWKDKERTFKEELTEKVTKEAARETAKRLIRKGQMSLEDIADCVPDLSMEELKELEGEVMNLV